MTGAPAAARARRRPAASGWRIDPRGLTAVDGLAVGHATMAGRPTGCTVIVADAPVVAAIDIRGGAPATRETDLLDPANLVPGVDAILLGGGSAFGLDAAAGVMRWLDDQGRGFDTGVARVPIVSAACLFDLAFGDAPSIRPDADCGYRAAAAASTACVVEGNVGAGAGATVGKLAGPARAMKAGVGSAAITSPDGLVIAALVVVNAVGDVVDPATGRLIAGQRDPAGRVLTGSAATLRERADGSSLGPRPGAGPGEHTTIGVVATNAMLSKADAGRFARMAMTGYPRAIRPVHTPFDGDALFALATGRHRATVDLLGLGAIAADIVATAIVRAATRATALGGLPAAGDFAHGDFAQGDFAQGDFAQGDFARGASSARGAGPAPGPRRSGSGRQ